MAFTIEIWAQNGVLDPLVINQIAQFVELSHISRVTSHTDTSGALYFTIQICSPSGFLRQPSKGRVRTNCDTHQRLTRKRRAAKTNSFQKTTEEYGLYSSPEAASPAPQRPRDETSRDGMGRGPSRLVPSRLGPPRAVPSSPAPPRPEASCPDCPRQARSAEAMGRDWMGQDGTRGGQQDGAGRNGARLPRPALCRPFLSCPLSSRHVLPERPRQFPSRRGPRPGPKSGPQD